MKEMLLFGAGASQEAGVPTAFGLTNQIAAEFHQRSDLRHQAGVVSFVLGGLLFNRGIQGQNPLESGVNVEEFFNAIQLLAGRHSLEAAPFVGSWHSMIEEFDKVRPTSAHPDRVHEIIFKSVMEKVAAALPTSLPAFGASDIDKKIKDAIKGSVEAAAKGRSSSFSSSVSVGREVGDLVMGIMKRWVASLKAARPSGSDFTREFNKAVDQQPRPGEGRIFRQVADAMIAMLVKFVLVEDPSKVRHLTPLKTIVSEQSRITIASLNYDNCVELFCEDSGIPCDTGIDEWSEKGTFEGGNDGIFLLKLHGSIDWQQTNENRTDERPMPHRIIKRASADEAKGFSYRPAVIFGSRNKLTAEGPFLDLLRAFQRELQSADRLTVVGYAFCDAHINVYLSQWLNSSPAHRLRIINGPAFADKPEGYVLDLLRFARDRVEIVPKYAGEGLLDAFSQMTLEEIVDA
jgi:SIR2-like domain